MENENNEIRERVRKTLIELRESRGLTQTDIGELVGKTKTSVSAWETGASLPDLATLYKLSKFYRKPLEYMYGERDTHIDLITNDENKMFFELHKKIDDLDVDEIGQLFAFADFLKSQKKKEGDDHVEQ